MLRERGATLVEMVVAMAIIAILMSIGVPSMRTWIVRTQVTTKAEAVLNGVQLARVEALKRNARVFFTLSNDSSWTLGCVTVVGDTDGDGLADCPSQIQSKSAGEGGSGPALTLAPTNATTVTFNGVGLTTANSDASATLTQVDVSSTSGSETHVLSVRITGGGQSRVCVPSTATAYSYTEVAKRC